MLASTNVPTPFIKPAAVAPEDWCWLMVMAGTCAVESLWWLAAFGAGVAPLPSLLLYLVLSFAALGAALALRTATDRRRGLPCWRSVLLGTALVALGASLFLPLKFAIPAEIPFWLDAPLAAGEQHLFAADPWLLLDRLLGALLVPIDRVYGLWLPVQSLVLFSVMLQRPSEPKARALIAYSLAWFVLGVAAAALLSSAGPIFHDRLLGGHHFAALHDRLVGGGAVLALAESDRMWQAFASGRPGIVAGMSAMPSLHVAISLWIYLAARTQAPRAAPAAFAYFVFISIASVQLGWHYVADGFVGVLGMLGLWHVAGLLNDALQPIATRRRLAPASGQAACQANVN